MAKDAFPDAYGCRHSGMPLGGIGAGSLEIRPDGYFYRWCLMNNRPWGAGPATDAMERYGLRFGLVADWGEGRRGLALGKHPGLDPGPDGWFWFSDPYHLPWIAHARDIRFEARPPFARLAYEFDGVPLGIDLAAWSPFIPYRAADSNTPGAVLEFRVMNPTAREAHVTLVGVLKNAVGYDRPDLVSACGYVKGEWHSLLLSREGMEPSATTAGTMALAARAAGEHGASYALHAPHGRALWDALLETGRLPNEDFGRRRAQVGEVGAEKEVRGPVGLARSALAIEFAVPPGETVECTYILTWHFPNFRELAHRNAPEPRLIGLRYAERFADASAVAAWLGREHQRLAADARRFHDAFYATSLPPWLLKAVAAGWSVLYRSAWWDRQGRFGIWEGLGCCGLQTIDVGHYASLAILQLFPELEAAQNRLSAANREPTGKVPHLMPGTFGCNDSRGGRGRIDLGAQWVLAVWRSAVARGNLDDARDLWPAVEQNLELLAQADADGDGLPNNQGPDQTYDRFPLFGTSAYVGFLYLAALRAAADLAQRLGRHDRNLHYTALADRAAGTLERQLWNGRYFNLSYDPYRREANTGCMTDQLNGDWFWRQASGTALVNDRRVRQALRSVLRHNRRSAGRQAWIANCSWPRGGGARIVLEGSDQVNCPWSGVEYALAAHLALVGLPREALRIARDVFARYEEAGLRFDHVECGEFYYRALSVWSVYQAMWGLAYDGLAARLTAAPPEGDARFLVTVPSGCAEARWAESAGTLALAGLIGRIELRAFRFRGRDVPIEPATIEPGREVTLHP